MREITFLSPPPVFIEISQTRLLALREGTGREIPLEREPEGNLTGACQKKIIADLQDFADRKFWQTRPRAVCALGANGVVLRRLSLPAADPESFRKLLLLQIESELPLPPEALAWGFSPLTTASAAGKQDVLVAAVKKEVVEEHAKILVACGFDPVFTVAALARNEVCPEPAGSHALLEIQSGRAELAVFADGVPAGLRVLLAASESALAAAVAKALGTGWHEKKIFVSGTAREAFGSLSTAGRELVPLNLETGTGRSAATLGLKKTFAANGGTLPVTLQVKAKPASNLSKPGLKIWIQRAALLLAALLLVPYAEALLRKRFLVRQLTRLRADQGRLLTIDRELDFLDNLKQTQPPYLDALFVFAKSAPPGARLEALTLNRRGEVSLRGTMQNGQLVTEFRSKLIASGFFANVSVEEQTPTPDRQKVNVRITAQWKPVAVLAGLALGPSAEEIERAKTNKTVSAGGGFPPGMFPMMPGAPPRPLPGRN